MKLETVLNEIITIEELSHYVAYYEVSYQGALGFITSFSSGFDPEDATQRLNSMNFELVPQEMFTVIIRIALESKDNLQIHHEIKKEAAIKALDDIMEKDHEILNREIFHDQMEEMIQTEIFFDPKMEQFIQDNQPSRQKVWKNVLTDTMIASLRDNLKTVQPSSES